MTESDEDWFDTDIAALELGYGEKAGLQIFRNYRRAFDGHAAELLRQEIANTPLDLTGLTRVVELVSVEDVRLTIVIACGYADDILRKGFEKALPADIPGGVSNMLGGFGPLGDFSKRIRLGYAFELASRDLLADIDNLRRVRNRVSHDWDIASASLLLDHPKLSEMYPVELDVSTRLTEKLGADIEEKPEEHLRVRLIWLLGRLTYELEAFPLARKSKLEPSEALYGKEGGENRTKWLKAIAEVCLAATEKLWNVRR